MYPGSSTQSQFAKMSSVSNPLISISKASTPIRKRIVKPAQPMNSTPVNINKLGNQVKSPKISNKQNKEQANTKFNTKLSKLPQKNINLSPILALNRKMSTGALLQQKCYTPQAMNKDQSLNTLLQQNSEQITPTLDNINSYENTQNLHYFKNIRENRSKTPTRATFNQSRQSMGNTCFGAFKLDIGTNKNRMRESKSSNLMTSDSFQSFKNLTSQLKQNQLPCINQHGRQVRAKYKVIEQNESEDEEMLIYCSKCAILLAKKGFKVQELTKKDIQIIRGKSSITNNDFENNKYYDYAEQTYKRLKIRLQEMIGQKQAMIGIYNRALDDINCYYDSIIAMVQSQRKKDQQLVSTIKQEDKNSGQVLEIKIDQAIKQLQRMMRTNKVGPKQLQIIQNFESLMTAKCMYTHILNNNPLIDCIQQKFNQFTDTFNNNLRLKFDREQLIADENYHSNPVPYQKYEKQNLINHKPSAQCPLRFSFENNNSLKQFKSQRNIGYQTNYLGNNQQIQEEEGESGEISNQNSKKAFRTLFPEDTQIDDGPQRQKNGIHSPTFKQF